MPTPPAPSSTGDASGSAATVAQLVEQLDFHWRDQLRPRLEGLTDDEYLWEPAPGCWTIAPRELARSTMAVGAGEYVIDWQWPPPEPPPVTTIAWRLGHVAVPVLGARAANHFGDGGVRGATTTWSPRARDALALLDDHYASWMSGLRGLTDEDLWRPCGQAEAGEDGEDDPLVALVLHVNREVIHHGGEVCLLRDLYRARPLS